MPRVLLLATVIGSAIIGLVIFVTMLIEDVRTEKENGEGTRLVEKIDGIYLEMKKSGQPLT